jgi:hypothetical protein
VGYIAMKPSEDRDEPSHHRDPPAVGRGDPAVSRRDPAVKQSGPPLERDEMNRNTPTVRANPTTTAPAPEIDRRFRQFFVLANNSL